MNPDLISSILLDGLMAAIAATGFAVISNPPRRAIAVSAVLAAVGHAFRFYMLHSWTIDISSATFIAAFTIGMLGVMTAKLVKCPAEIFAFPSLLPMMLRKMQLSFRSKMGFPAYTPIRPSWP